jgi:hypothetical protein
MIADVGSFKQGSNKIGHKFVYDEKHSSQGSPGQNITIQ